MAFSGQEKNSEQDMCMEQHSVPARVRAPCRSADVPGLVESWVAELGGRGARSGVGPWPSSSLQDGLLLLLSFCFSGKAVGRSAEEQQRSCPWSGWVSIPCRVPSRGQAGGSSTGEDENKVVPIQLPHLTSAPLHRASLDRGFARNLPACLLNTFTLGGFCQSNLWQ